jgi:geranylgeranyl reductase family protein
VNYDVIVVGGGPGGSTAARECAKKGLKTLIIDKEKFPREKLCGGAFSEHARLLLDYKIPDWISKSDVFGARVFFGQNEIVARKKDRIAVLLYREDLDSFMLDKAMEEGAEFKNEKLLNLEVTFNFVKIFTNKNEYHCKFLIGADGANSRVSNFVRAKMKSDEYAIALAARIDKNFFDEPLIELYFGQVYMGYAWIFPLGDKTSVGVGALASKSSGIKNEFFKFLKTKNVKEKINFKGHMIPAGGFDRELVSDRILLVGDAAGFVDSFYGEGIAFAIHSAKIASKVVSESLEKDTFSKKSLSIYKSRCNHEFGTDLKYSLYFTKLMHKYPNIFLDMFTASPKIVEKYLDIPLKKMEYRNYLYWMILHLPAYKIRKLIAN